MINSLYLHVICYMTPAVRYKLSYNRAHSFVPKDEIGLIHQGIVTLFGLQLSAIPCILIVFIGNGIYKYSVKTPLCILMIVSFLIAFIIMHIAKKRGYYAALIEEADEMTLKEHRKRKKRLLLTSFLRYLLSFILSLSVSILSNFI